MAADRITSAKYSRVFCLKRTINHKQQIINLVLLDCLVVGIMVIEAIGGANQQFIPLIRGDEDDSRVVELQ